MRNLFPKTFLVTWIAVGALCPGGVRAQAARLCSNQSGFGHPGTGHDHRSPTRQPLGRCAQHHEPVLGLEPRDQYEHSLRRYRQDDGHQGQHQPASRRCIDPDNGQPDHKDRPARSTIPTLRRSWWEMAETVNSAHFIFANLNGTISAWDTGTTAFIQVTTAGAIYTGLAINGAQTQLYAANDAGAGSIDVFDSTFTPVSLAAGAFVDPALPAGLVPFNVQDISGFVYVVYAPAGRANQISAPFGARGDRNIRRRG